MQGTQYVTLGIGDEVFAVPVAQVREVLDLTPVTRVPNMPAFMRGMIDVRGQAVPVIDMRAKFGLTDSETTPHTRIVVLEIGADGRRMVIGALTDRVFEVVELADDAVEAPPDIGFRWRSDFLRGIGRVNGGFAILLNLDRLFSSEELAVA